jgi:HAD superfamily hydrolase (TIGR01459 family)
VTARRLTGLRAIVGLYDVFVIDLWGTLYDGVAPYPGAVRALTRLAAAGKRIALLSNAPRRAALAGEMLTAAGFAPQLYAMLLSSGEATHAALRDRPDRWHARLSGPCWHLGPPRDRSIFEGLALDVRSTPEGAGFCVVTGTRLNEETVEDYRDELDRALALGLPMICANPDMLVPVGDALVVCPGAFAGYYADRGGDVFWHGKPHRSIYDTLFAQLETTGGAVDPARTIAIGDGLQTDILGAANAGVASLLLTGGVHRRELRVDWRGRPDKTALAGLLDAAPARPDYWMTRLVW